MSFQWYFNALNGVAQEVHEDSPQPGFYRVRTSKEDRTFIPIAIWRKGDELVAKKGFGGGAQMIDAIGIWSYACRNPVKEDAYRAVCRGEKWPDEADPAPTIGHNLPTDPAMRLLLTLEVEKTALIEWNQKNPVDSDDKANILAEVKLRLAGYQKEAENLRVEEKKPILEAGRAIDAKWNPVVNGFTDLTRDINSTVKVYLDKKQAELRRIAMEKAQAERAAEQARRDAVAAEAAARGIAMAEPEPLPEPEPIEAPRARVGNTGAAISLKEVRVPVITDMVAFLSAQQAHPDIVAAANKVAGAIIRAKLTAPGLSFTTETKV